jgi:ABC-2 type transport system permease protein
LAVVAGLLALVVASLAMGILLAAFFVLSRRANLMANFIQHPINLLAGFIIPRAELPGWLRPFSDVLPIAHAVDAFRASTLAGASLVDIGGTLIWSLSLSGAFVLIGTLGIRRIEHAAKRTGQLELF